MLKNLERKRTVAWVKVRLQTTVPLLPGTMFRTVKTIETKMKKKKIPLITLLLVMKLKMKLKLKLKLNLKIIWKMNLPNLKMNLKLILLTMLLLVLLVLLIILNLKTRHMKLTNGVEKKGNESSRSSNSESVETTKKMKHAKMPKRSGRVTSDMV
jgi:hypothetical protein